MKNKMLVPALLASLFMFMLIVCFLLGTAFSHPSTKVVQMEDGEMIIIKGGKAMAMTTEMTMNN